MEVLNSRKLVMAPWCEDPDSEDLIKKRTTELSAASAEQEKQTTEEGGAAPALTGAMKPLCIPIEQVSTYKRNQLYLIRRRIVIRLQLQ